MLKPLSMACICKDALCRTEFPYHILQRVLFRASKLQSIRSYIGSCQHLLYIMNRNQRVLPCNLLDLPDAALSAIVTLLAAADKQCFKAACSKTFQMTIQAAEITLKITKDTRFAGIRKILDSYPAQIHLEIITPSCQGDNDSLVYQSPLSALAMFMGTVPSKFLTQVAASCQWEGITKVTIQGVDLRCLLPQFIALTCPWLQQLKIVKPQQCYQQDPFTTSSSKALPLTPCISLRQLEYKDFEYEHLKSFELPTSHHSITALRQSLPNIDTLTFTAPNADLIEAYAIQLTRLVITQSTAPVHEQIRMCSNLQHLSIRKLMLPDNAPALTVVELEHCSSDDEFQQLLELPSLTALCLGGLGDINEDWSDHVCRWQELHLNGYVHFEILDNLNLRGLKKLTFGPDLKLLLPDSSDPSSFTAVQQAAFNLSHVEEIQVAQRKTDRGACFGECGSIAVGTGGSSQASNEHEQKAAEMVRTALHCIGEFKVAKCMGTLEEPLEFEGVMSWGRTFIESVCFGIYYDVKPQVWESLQRLEKLHTITFCAEDDDSPDSSDEVHARQMLSFACAVRGAARQYVIPAQRRLRMDFGFLEYMGDDALETEGVAFLRAAIQQVLPAGCELISVEVFSLVGNDLYTAYGNAYDASAHWVVVVAPVQATM